MSWKRTILSLIILILMVMALILDTQILRNKTVRAVRDASLADSVDISAVDQITLKNNQGTVRLVRTTVGWRMKEPVDAPADPEVVETVLTNVTSARRRNAVDAKNLAQYGLGTPEVQLTLVSQEGKFGDWGTSFGLELGYDSVYTGQVFGKYPGTDEVFTVGEHVKNTLLRSPMDFRRSRVLEVDTGNLEQYTSFQIATANEDGVILSNNRDGWQIAEPVQATAEKAIVSEYFNRLGVLRAMGYISQDSDRPTSMAAALQALTSPTLTVTLTGAAGIRAQQLNVSLADGPDGPVYVAQHPGEQEVMVLSSETVSEIRRNSQYFRSRDLFTMTVNDVGLFTIQIARAAPTALIRNDQNEWELVGDQEFRINQSAVNERLAALVGLRIADYVDPNPVDLANYGLDNPRVRFNMTSKDKTKTESLEVGGSQGEAGGLSYARSSTDKGIFTVQMSREMFILASEIADKNFAAADLTRLAKVELDIDEQTYELKREGDEWKLLKPTQSTYTTVDLREIGNLLGMINGLEYVEDITGSSQVVVAPDKGPPISVRFYDQNDAQLNEMNVTARINRLTSLVTNGRDRTFEVSTPVIEQIYAAAKNLVR